MNLTEEVKTLDKKSVLVGAAVAAVGLTLYKKFFQKSDESDAAEEDAEESE